MQTSDQDHAYAYGGSTGKGRAGTAGTAGTAGRYGQERWALDEIDERYNERGRESRESRERAQCARGIIHIDEHPDATHRYRGPTPPCPSFCMVATLTLLLGNRSVKNGFQSCLIDMS